MADTMIGVIGGSGVYEIDGLERAEWISVETPWGDPSDQILTGSLDGLKMAFLPRHGRGHVHSPTTVPYRANIDALKRIGVTDVVSVSACGSFREEMAPGDFVVVVNAEKVKLTGNKETQKTYMSYSGWRSGDRYRSIKEVRANHPDRIITHAVKGMIPKNRLGRRLLTKLKVYSGPTHPHTAQNPATLTVDAQ